MTDWRYQYPSTSLKRDYKGSEELGRTFDGAGNKLLYELKKHMEFQKLGQLKMTRFFSDGTVITAKSHFGMDILEIDVTQSTGLAEITCTVTLVNLPDAIAPMNNAGEILETEVEGIDYIKTYYLVDTNECGDCQDVEFTICTTEEIAEDEALCKPFYYQDSLVDSTDVDPNDHCVRTTSHCQAEIIDFAEDGGGTYFRWKAYTEWPPDDQSGLGYLLFRAFIKREVHDDELCESGRAIVTVDCCEKNDDAYKEVHPEPEWGDLDIEYTSLMMGCSETQELTSKYGCPPFTWTLTSGNGTLTPAEDGLTAVYESPETNPNCTSNPIILLEDRCSSVELKLAVNCYEPPWVALAYGDILFCPHECDLHPGTALWFCHFTGIVRGRQYDCSGNLVATSLYKNYQFGECQPVGIYDCSELLESDYWLCAAGDTCVDFSTVCGDCNNIWTTVCASASYLTFDDWRTPEVKAAGCCPLNPITGLPY
jgi:hypothetical protein